MTCSTPDLFSPFNNDNLIARALKQRTNPMHTKSSCEKRDENYSIIQVESDQLVNQNPLRSTLKNPLTSRSQNMLLLICPFSQISVSNSLTFSWWYCDEGDLWFSLCFECYVRGWQSARRTGSAFIRRSCHRPVSCEVATTTFHVMDTNVWSCAR